MELRERGIGSIARPLAAAAAVLGLTACLATQDAITRLGTAVEPVAPPIVTVHAAWPHATPSEVEGQLIAPLEAALNGLPSLAAMTSTSWAGAGRIELEFDSGTDPFAAGRGVLEAMQARSSLLPPDADTPMMAVGAQTRAATIVFRDGALFELQDRARALRPELARIPAVQRLDLVGVSEPRIHVLLDPHRLAAMGVTATTILSALSNTEGSVDELGAIVVSVGPGGIPIQVRDLAEISLGSDPLSSRAWLDGEPVAAIEVLVRTDAELPEVLRELEPTAAAFGGKLLHSAAAQTIRCSSSGSLEETGRALRRVGSSARSGAQSLGLIVAGPARDAELRIWTASSADLAAVMKAASEEPELRCRSLPEAGRRRVVELTGPDRQSLQQAVAELEQRLGALAGVPWVGSASPPARPEAQVEVDRAAAAQQGLTVAEVTTALRLTEGQIVGDARRRPILVRVGSSGGPDDLAKRLLVVTGADGLVRTIPLVSVAAIRTSLAAPVLVRRDGQPAALVPFDLDPTADAGAIEVAVEALIGSFPLPSGVAVQLRAPLGGPR